MRLLAAWGPEKFKEDWVIRSNTLVPLRIAAVRDAVCSVEGEQSHVVFGQLPGGDGDCACVSGIWWEAFQPQQSWKAERPVCQRPHKPPTLGRGDRVLKPAPFCQ